VGRHAERFETTTRELWWQEQGITRFVAGVFEGGGAKGLLYRGALEAMVEDDDRRCWFSAVAGASAGAITATLIAAGLEPVQVGDEAAKALGTLRKPTLLNGSLRIRNGASYLDQDSLADWLQDVLERHIRELCAEGGGESVTFEELYRLTGIELDVVAVDLNRQRVVIFNYKLTPTCAVTEAVVASTAIPMAFEWRPLSLPQPPFGIIVDGGVMANFPTFVFKDPSFREWAGLRQHPPSVPVVGFLLDEQDRAEVTRPDLYRESSFWPPMSQWGSVVKAIGTSGDKPLPDDFEPERRKFRPHRKRPSTAASLARVLGRPLRIILWPAWKLLFDWMPAVLRRNAGDVRGNWPQPKNPVLRWLVHWFDALIAGTRPWGVFLGGFLAASLCIGVGAYFVAWRPLFRHVGDLISGDVGIIGGIIGLVFWLVWGLVPIYAWMLISIVFFVGWLIHRTVQMTGYGLVKTFLQGPAAPLWAGAASDDHVVRLQVPRGITTLTVSIGDKEVAAALEAARAATCAELRQLEFPGIER
jgi:predicted acylesterase/phospholipase RssA